MAKESRPGGTQKRIRAYLNNYSLSPVILNEVKNLACEKK